MSRCPGCKFPIRSTEILCYRCLEEDLRVRWPTCQTCYRAEAKCGESGYQLCYACYDTHLRWLHQQVMPIQRLTRVFLARRLSQKKHKAAKQIQALWRGHLTRLQLVTQA